MTHRSSPTLPLPEDDALLPPLLRAQHLARVPFTIDAIQLLKDYSAGYHFSDPQRALQIAQYAYKVSQHLPPPAPALGAWTLGNALMFVDQYVEADRLFTESRALYFADGNQLDAARMSVGHVSMLAYTGHGEAALALVAEAAPILTAAGQDNQQDLERLGKLLMNAGVAHELMGQYEEALAVYDRQQHIAETLKDTFMLAQLTNNRAYALMQIGAYTEAVTAYQQAEQRFLQVDTQAEMVRFYYNYASLLTLMGRFDEARALQDRAEDFQLAVEETENQHHWMVLMRTTLDLQAGWTIADATILALQQAQESFQQHGPIFAAGMTWLVLARCYLQRKAWQSADDALSNAQHHAEQFADRTLTYQVQHGFGQLAEKQMQFDDAVTAYQTAIQQIESIRQDFQVEAWRADFLTDKLVVYQDLVGLYRQQGQLIPAFQTVERAKARLLTEKLVFRLNQEAETLLAVADEQVKPETAQLTTILRRLDKLYMGPPDKEVTDDVSPMGPQERARLIAQLEEKTQILIYQLQHNQSLFSVYASGKPIEFSTISTHLENRLLLQYHINHGKVWVFLSDAQGLLSCEIIADIAEVEAARQAFTRVVERTLGFALRDTAHLAQRLPTLSRQAEGHLSRLYDMLFRPIQAAVAGYEALVIVPDQGLHYVPFQALFDGEQYLVEQYTISYAPSAAVMTLCQQHSPKGKGILLCGYDNQELDAVSTELATLRHLLPMADLLHRDDCSSTNLLQKAPHYRVLHLATHAKFRMDKPLLSSLRLADRPLTLGEIARLPLSAELVVLSGCETGYGQLHGADLLSLAGGFLSAGSSSLLVSLWRVEDSITGRLMETFYQALLVGTARAEALQQAQQAIIHLARTSEEYTVYNHPAFWAPFILIGQWQPVDLIDSTSNSPAHRSE